MHNGAATDPSGVLLPEPRLWFKLHWSTSSLWPILFAYLFGIFLSLSTIFHSFACGRQYGGMNPGKGPGKSTIIRRLLQNHHKLGRRGILIIDIFHNKFPFHCPGWKWSPNSYPFWWQLSAWWLAKATVKVSILHSPYSFVLCTRSAINVGGMLL